MPLHCFRVFADCPHVAPAGPRRTTLREPADLRSGFRIEEDSVRPDELQGIPLDRVMARGENQSGRRLVVLHGELDRGSRDHAEVDHIYADRHESGGSGPGEHCTAGAGVPAEDDCRAVGRAGGRTGGASPRAERRRVARHQLGGEIGPHVSPDSGDAHHQSVGHLGWIR